jgi:hypothetical protein
VPVTILGSAAVVLTLSEMMERNSSGFFSSSRMMSQGFLPVMPGSWIFVLVVR